MTWYQILAIILFGTSTAFLIRYIFYTLYVKEFSHRPILFFTPFILLLLIFFLGWLTLFFTFNIEKNSKTASSDIVLLIDVSQSMQARDIKGTSRNQTLSRIDSAKEFIRSLVTTYPYNRYSLVVFARDMSILLPFTNDSSLILRSLENIENNIFFQNQGTHYESVGKNLSILYDSLKKDTSFPGGGIFLLSDFEFHEKNKYPFRQDIAKIIETYESIRTKIIPIGFGTIKGAKIPISEMNGITFYKKDASGKDVITKFDKQVFDAFNASGQQGFIIENIKHIPSYIAQIENIPLYKRYIPTKQTEPFTRYLVIQMYVLFLGFLFLYSYLFMLGKKNT